MNQLKKPITTLFVLGLLIVIAGCGYNPEDPVYDTADNPEDFPKMAISVLDRLQAGELSGLDSVSNAFADLYITHPDLLDKAEWQLVVDRLGAKFKFLAEQLRRSEEFSIGTYSTLADYYTLASFARPMDTGLTRKAELFECWRIAVDNYPRLETPVGRSVITADQKIEIIRDLAFSSPVCHTFLHDYLKSSLFDELPNVARLNADQQALLRLAGYDIEVNFEPLVGFASPRIDLVAFRITELDSVHYDVEMYFIPHDTVTENYEIAFWVYTTEDQPEGAEIGEQRFPFDFEPLRPSSQWRLDQVAVAHQTIEYAGTIGSVTVGLYASKGSRLDFVKVMNTDRNLISLPVQ